MVNEFTLQLQQFIATCNNKLLKYEALETLHRLTWQNLNIAVNKTNAIVRTEQIFKDYCAAKPAIA